MSNLVKCLVLIVLLNSRSGIKSVPDFTNYVGFQAIFGYRIFLLTCFLFSDFDAQMASDTLSQCGDNEDLDPRIQV